MMADFKKLATDLAESFHDKIVLAEINLSKNDLENMENFMELPKVLLFVRGSKGTPHELNE